MRSWADAWILIARFGANRDLTGVIGHSVEQGRSALGVKVTDLAWTAFKCAEYVISCGDSRARCFDGDLASAATLLASEDPLARRQSVQWQSYIARGSPETS